MKRDELFPAYAGVIPTATSPARAAAAFPRIRGGDPGLTLPVLLWVGFSPHTRG